MTLRAVHVEQIRSVPVSEFDVEIVERKGKGHPDSLIDGAAEAVSRSLSQHYLEHFGTVLHHNVDKGLLVGGKSNVRFGGGEIVEPINIIVAGRATRTVDKGGNQQIVPVNDLAQAAVSDFLKSTLRFLDTNAHVQIDCKIRPGSADLVALFQRSAGVPISNDTSIGVGFAPLTPTERIVLESERFINSKDTKRELPELGEDVKVMALRTGKSISLTIAVPAIASLTPNKRHYIGVMHDVAEKVRDLGAKLTGMEVGVTVNGGDDYERGVFYLTVTGTSAESGDDGNTGRGNRASGLITPMRQYSMEATAGKNPVNHTGKIFNVLAHRAANRIHQEVKGITEVYVRLLSRIGQPIDQPQIVSAAVLTEKSKLISSVTSEIESILNDELQKITSLTPMILRQEVPLF